MKLSVVGSGMIATEVMTLLRKEFPQVEIASIFVRPESRAKGEELARRFQVPVVYTDYDELLKHPVDYVYVANVNTVHYEYARKALLAGQNIIVEKPLCSTLQQAQDLFCLAEEKGLYMLEAVSFLYTPNYAFIRENLQRIGKIHVVQANYSQYSSRYNRYLNGDVAPAFNPDLDGGALRDLNVYNINLLAGLFGRPEEVKYYANRGFNGVDTSGILVLKYPEFVATCTGAKDCGGPSQTCIQGEKGWIRVVGPANALETIEICIDGQTETYRLNQYEHRLGHEFQAFAEIYANRDYQRVKQQKNISLTVMSILESARKV